MGDMKQRKWIRITVVFFALMIVLTIFSRATASAARAKVTVTKAEGKTIAHEMKTSGTIEARDYNLQYVPEGLMIRSLQVSPGDTVTTNDVLFTVDTQKLQEDIKELETQLSAETKKDALTVSRAEQTYQEAEADAARAKDEAYRAYTEAKDAYDNYKKTQSLSGSDVSEEAVGSGSDENAANELKTAMDSAKDAYDDVVWEQDKLVRAAADSLKQTKEDLELTDTGKQLSDKLEDLRKYLQNDGQVLAEYAGTVGQIMVTPGSETVEGAAVLIADSSDMVRLTATLTEDSLDEKTGESTVTIKGRNSEGKEETYTVEDISVAGKTEENENGTQKMYQLTADIPGTLYPVGSTVEITISQNASEYDTCIPLASLRQSGTDEYFIYITEEEDTVLGTETVARKLPVTILDMDESYAAIEGEISGSVIVTTNKDIVDGSRIRIIE